MYDQTECSGAVFSLVYENSIAYDFFHLKENEKN